MDNPAHSGHLKALGYQGDIDVAQAWLDAAWRALCREVPSVETRIAAAELEVAVVIDVVAAAALRVLRNPEGVESDSGAIDDYQEARKHADATQDVYFTAAELRRLQPADAAFLSGFSGSVKYC